MQDKYSILFCSSLSYQSYRFNISMETTESGLSHLYYQMIDAAKMFERAIMPLDQSRCLEALGYFGKSISVLVDSANFDSALNCLNSALSQRKSVVSWNNFIIFCVVVFIYVSVNPTILIVTCTLYFFLNYILILTNI